MLELTVFLSGALVMVLEMVGARVLAPHVGTSAIVWTSLIGVVLACMALGAWAGGRWADKKLSRRCLGQVLAGAGAGCGLAAFCHAAVGAGVTSAIGNLYLAAVAAAAGIFAVPGFFFGMITPYVIRLRIASVDTSGTTVGRLYALSTAGSILGTFLGGFVLISFFSSTTILWGAAIGMLLLSLGNAPARPLLRLLLLVLCALSAWQHALYRPWLAHNGEALMLESPYNSIRITEGLDPAEGGRRVRLLATDPGYSQSGMYLDAPAELYFKYTRFYALAPYFVPKAQNVLMLGGGGYSLPKWLLSGRGGPGRPGGPDGRDLRLTVVELDPAMTAVARRWFGLGQDARLTVLHEDARAFLNRQNARYDLVFVDVFNSHYSVPFQMATLEAAQALRRAVAPGGALMMNVISALEGEDGRLFRGIYNALAAAFPDVRVFCVGRPDRPAEVQNLMLLAFAEKRPETGSAFASAGEKAPPATPELAAMLRARYLRPVQKDILPLTDDLAPVERYALMLLQ